MDNHSFRAAAIIGYQQMQDAAKDAGLELRIERNQATNWDVDDHYDFVLTRGGDELARSIYAINIRDAIRMWVKMQKLVSAGEGVGANG